MTTSKFLLLILLLIFLVCGCNSPSSKNNAEIQFLTQEFNFGKLKFGDAQNCAFEFHNPGNTPLIIQNVKPSCGCTAPFWPDEPIKPGENGKIGIKYNANDAGIFIKYLTVYYNGYNSPITLIIKGEVDSL